MLNIHILDDYHNTIPTLPGFRKIEQFNVTVWNDHVQDNDILAERLKDADVLVLMRERTKIDGDLLDRLPGLKLISQRGGGPHIDLEGCTRNGVIFSANIRGGEPSYSTAELAWLLILATWRQLPTQIAWLKAGKWQSEPGRTVRGSTIGLYGYGKIAGAVAEYARAFGVNVQWWGSEGSRERAKADGETVPENREAFFATSDIVSVHLRLVPATRGIITAQDLANMREDALFVNVSRAPLVEPGALLAALNAGRPGYAAVDVYEHEPLTDTSDPLINHPNVIATPHIGYVTRENLDSQYNEIYDQILAWHAGNPINVVNPEVLAGT